MISGRTKAYEFLPHCWLHGLPTKGSLAEVNTGDSLFYKKHYIDGTVEAVYHVNIIDILDKVFITGSMDFLSIEQRRFISKFIDACGIITDNINNEAEDIYGDTDKAFVDLDKYLAGYFGVDNGQYTR